MSDDDLRDLLGMAPDAVSGDADGAVSLITGRDDDETVEIAAPSPTALELDRWGVRKGQEVLLDNEQIYGACEKIASADEERMAHVAADMYGAAFELNPQLVEKCEDEDRHSFLKTMMETEKYNALHSATQLDDFASSLAASAFAIEYAKLVEGRQKQEEQERQQPGGQPSPDDERRKRQRDEMAAVRAAGNALKSAQAEVDAAKDMEGALGWGSEAGAGSQLDRAKMAEAFKRMMADNKLRVIIERAGRYRRMAQSKQQAKVIDGRDDCFGVELSGDLSRILASELIMLKHPSLALETKRRILEGTALSRKYRGTEKIARGPIIVFVDESGSMSGEKEMNAKAICLTMAWIARAQKRWCCLVGFSHDPDNLRVLVLDPASEASQADLLEWICEFQNGGTTFEFLAKGRIDALCARTKAPHAKTDVILVTDGECAMEEGTVRTFLEWKAEWKAKLISIVIGGRGDSLERVSNELFSVNNLNVDSEAVGKVFSI